MKNTFGICKVEVETKRAKTESTGTTIERRYSGTDGNPVSGKAVFIDIGTFVNGRDNTGKVFQWKNALKHVFENTGKPGTPQLVVAYANPRSFRERTAAGVLELLGVEIRWTSTAKNDSDHRLAYDVVEYVFDCDGYADIAILGGDKDMSYPLRRMSKRFESDFTTRIFCTTKSVAECWRDSIGWNGKFLPVDEFVVQAPPFIRKSLPAEKEILEEDGVPEEKMDILGKIIVESVTSSYDMGKHPTLRRTSDVVSERSGFESSEVFERAKKLLNDGYFEMSEMTSPDHGGGFNMLVPTWKAYSFLDRLEGEDDVNGERYSIA